MAKAAVVTKQASSSSEGNFLDNFQFRKLGKLVLKTIQRNIFFQILVWTMWWLSPTGP